MAVITCHFHPSILNMNTAMNIILPIPQKEVENEKGGFGMFYKGLGKFPVLWLLHGGTDYYGDWLHKSLIELYAEKHGTAVVMADAQNSSYIDMEHGPKWFSYFSKLLPDFVYGHFPISDRRVDNFIAGMSMGGYGAVNLALRCPERYCAVAGIATAVGVPKKYVSSRIEGKLAQQMTAIFGHDMNHVVGSKKDAYANAKSLVDSGKERPELLLLCGREDFTYQDNIEFRDYLQQIGYAAKWVEYAGAHNWDSWNHALPIIMEWLPIKR